nr:hypothetical protein [uncultured Duganella sp.]
MEVSNAFRNFPTTGKIKLPLAAFFSPKLQASPKVCSLSKGGKHGRSPRDSLIAYREKPQQAAAFFRNDFSLQAMFQFA